MSAVGLGVALVAHLALLLLPGVALAAVARPLWAPGRLAPTTVVLLGAGLVAELSFFAFFAAPPLGRAWTYGTAGASVVVLARRPGRRVLVALASRADVRVPVVLSLGVAVLFTGSLVLHGGADHPATASNGRYLAGLPIDNLMPFFLADRVIRGADVEPFVGDWKSSDRPPLQAGAVAYAHPLEVGLTGEAHYQLTGTALQVLWIAPLWLLLRRLRVPRRLVTPAVAVTALSGVSLLYTVFVWPKLLSAAYALVALAELVPDAPRRAAALRWAAAGTAIGLALLAHGGAVFVLLPLAVTAAGVALIRRPAVRRRAVTPLAFGAVALLAVLAPWAAYQRWVAPPGNRLVKWHLAGAAAIDGRSTLQALRDAYTEPSLRRILDDKGSNFSFLANHERVAGDVLPVTGSIDRVRQREFGQVFNALGVAWFGVPAALACVASRRRRRLPAVDAAAVVTGFAALGVVLWCLVLYGPQATFVHQSALAVVLLLMTGLSLFVGALDQRLAWLLVALGAWRLGRVWLFAPVPDRPGAPVSTGALLLVAAGTALCALALADGAGARRPSLAARRRAALGPTGAAG